MIIKGNSCKTFKNILEILHEFLDEAVFLFSKEGLYIVDQDRSHVMVIAVAIRKDYFEEYSLEEDMKIVVPLKKVFEIFRKSKENEKFILNTDGDKLIITIEGDVIRKNTLHLIGSEDNKVEEPSYDFSVSFLFPLENLDEIIGNGLVFGDELSFIFNDDQILFKASGNGEEGNFEISNKLNETIKIKTTRKMNLESKYDLKYLERITKISKNLGIDKCQLYFDENFPMKIKFLDKNLSISFYLGPRMD